MKTQLNFPVYPDLSVSRGGLLPNDKRAYALWYYYTLAQQLHEKLGKSTEDQFGLLDGDLWMSPRYEQLARSVALVYSFSNPGEFMEQRFWDVVAKQAVSMDLPDPTGRDYTRPLRLIMPS